MIKANELRIGNLLLSDACEVEVEGIDKYHEIITTANFEGSCNGNLMPMPITEEWLLKHGAKHRDSIHEDDYKDLNILYDTHDDSTFEINIIIRKGASISKVFKLIKHVHKLQNLVYELTDKELTTLDK